MIIAKVIRVQGDNQTQIDETASLLQEFLDKINPADLLKLLKKAVDKPSVIKTALKFI